MSIETVGEVYQGSGWPQGQGDGERGRGSPTHAIRRCIRTGLIRAGIEEAIVLYLVRQTQGITAAAYVPESSPEQSPYWPRLAEAVGRIPGVDCPLGVK